MAAMMETMEATDVDTWSPLIGNLADVSSINSLGGGLNYNVADIVPEELGLYFGNSSVAAKIPEIPVLERSGGWVNNSPTEDMFMSIADDGMQVSKKPKKAKKQKSIVPSPVVGPYEAPDAFKVGGCTSSSLAELKEGARIHSARIRAEQKLLQAADVLVQLANNVIDLTNDEFVENEPYFREVIDLTHVCDCSFDDNHELVYLCDECSEEGQIL